MGKSLFTTVVQPIAIISVTLSASVLLTVALFPEMIKGKIFIQIVALISLCDALGNWPYMLSYYPTNGSALCSFEGFCNLFFFPVSWLLTTFLTRLFRDIVVCCKINITMKTVLSVAVGAPLTFTLLLLTTNTYGSDSDDVQDQPCTYGGDYKTGYLWHLITYDSLLYLCLCIMLVTLGEILWREYTNRIASDTEMYRLMKRLLILYPVAMLICWFPHALCIVIPACYDALNTETYMDAIKISHGGFVAIIFFTVSNEARQQWIQLFSRLLGAKTPPPSSLWDISEVVGDRSTLCTTTLNRIPDDNSLAAMMTRNSTLAQEFSRPSRIELGTGPISIRPSGAIKSNINSSF
jgi:hypothetical protein